MRQGLRRPGGRNWSDRRHPECVAASRSRAAIHRRPLVRRHGYDRLPASTTAAATPLPISAIAKSKPVLQSDRDYSACTMHEHRRRAAIPRCGGSATANPGHAVFFPPRADTSTIAALGPERSPSAAHELYNFAPLNYFQRPDERYIAGAFADYEITRRSSRTSSSCSWTITRWRRSRRRATSATR